ncbi:MAG: tetratricopeptide repeat protein [Spirochaetaceae bacterium]|nr:tetratricopeptide repeat protein [Spirochaetaceae bacterium]
MEKLNQSEDKLSDLMIQVYGSYKNGAIEESASLLNEAHSIDYENKDVLTALKCTSFWMDRFEKLDSQMENFEKAEFLVKQWIVFSGSFTKSFSIPFEDGLYSLKMGIFRTALKFYSRVREGDSDPEPEILLRIGRCHKALGDYDRAITSLEKALKRNSQSSPILAELADCYFMIDKIRNAKVFFREAFFINPQLVDIDLLEADIIVKLVEEVKNRGYSGRELKEWLPVYAVIFGVFNVKRELRPIEYGKLKQTIYSLKNELQESEEKRLLLPKLINHYFWLIDHYLCIDKDWETVEEILLNIKLLVFGLYEQYTN